MNHSERITNRIADMMISPSIVERFLFVIFLLVMSPLLFLMAFVGIIKPKD